MTVQAMAGAGTEQLHAGPLVSIHEYRCNDANRAFGGEEAAGACEVVFVRAGAYEVESAGETFLADANTAIFFNPDAPYRVRHPVDGGDVSTVFTLDAPVLRDIMGVFDARAAERAELRWPWTHAHSPASAHGAQRRLLSSVLGRDADPVLIEEVALRVVEQAVAARRTARSRAAGERRGAAMVLRVKGVLAARFRERLRLEDIADASGYSPYHLSRVFSAHTGVSVHRYLNRLRLRWALEGIARGDGSLARLAMQAGFATPSHFSDAFRREFGVPPVRFLRNRGDAADLSKILKD